MRTLVSKIEELSIDKKVNEITQILNHKCDQIKIENQEEIKRVKEELEKDIMKFQNKKGIINLLFILQKKKLKKLKHCYHGNVLMSFE